ncbi:MAG: NADPH-dependent F420 reductase [Chloroflexi bacterium]|jgi:hypothetical protein|nr:NADPH-dependent F420 reductase [Chloroflexota bacterium]
MSYKIGIIGGTGRQGRGLAYRWAQAGHEILIGSRKLEGALAAVEELEERLGGEGKLTGLTNLEAVEACDIAVLTVPFEHMRSTLEELKDALQGKLLINVCVPLVPPKVTRVQMPPEGSGALMAQAILGNDARIVDAFQNVSFEHLLSGEEIDTDVLVAGYDKAARETVIQLSADIGVKAWDAGVIQNTMVVEGLTSILIGLNIQYKVPSSGIRITGVHE